MRKTGYKIFAVMFLLTCSMLLIFHQSITSAITAQNISSDSVSTMGAGFGGGHDKKGRPGMNRGHFGNVDQEMKDMPGISGDTGANGAPGANEGTRANDGQGPNNDQGNSNDSPLNNNTNDNKN